MMKTGVVLINLGTPDDTSIRSIRRYLREFLLDPRVIDLNPLLRWLLVYGAILPFRPYKSARAYRKIWRKEGSPLAIYSQALCHAVQKNLGDDFQVVMAMRYASPSITSALKQLNEVDQVIVLPLFPQYSSAATGSAMAKFMVEAAYIWNIPKIKIIDQFYQDPGFIESYVDIIRPHVSNEQTFLLLSYHGLPERHLDKSKCFASCDRRLSCPAMANSNYFCYRAQCYQTSKLIASSLSLSDSRYMSSFQSRLGRIPWIKPYTDDVLPKLYQQGIRHLVVACPAFVADCLETLEEIGIEAKAQWLALGGKSFSLVPCLNDSRLWVDAVTKLIRSQMYPL